MSLKINVENGKTGKHGVDEVMKVSGVINVDAMKNRTLLIRINLHVLTLRFYICNAMH